MSNKISGEFGNCTLGDKRLNRRLALMAEKLYSKIGESIPTACGNWAETKAAYRLLAHPEISEHQIIEGHFQATAERFREYSDRVLVIHDTTEFAYHRKASTLGKLTRVFAKKGNPRDYMVTVQGILMHSSLVVTLQGLPIGISAIKFWTRKKFKGVTELRKHVNATRIPIEKKESVRWIENIRQTNELLSKPKQCIHIGDREADIYELYSECQTSGTYFVVRLDVNRRVAPSPRKLFESLREEPSKGQYCVTLSHPDGKKEKIPVEVRFKEVKVLPPIGKEKNYPAPISGFFIKAKEKLKKGAKGNPRLEWKLLTNIPVRTFAQAYEKIQWYAMRWKIETFFKILKSGCKTEQSKLRNAKNLAKFISLCAVISWKVFWLNMLNRTNPKTDSKHVLSKTERNVLNAYQIQREPGWKGKSITDYLIVIAKIGGFLNRKSDWPPGNIVTWRGVSRLNDIIIGFNLGAKFVGN